MSEQFEIRRLKIGEKINPGTDFTCTENDVCQYESCVGKYVGILSPKSYRISLAQPAAASAESVQSVDLQSHELAELRKANAELLKQLDKERTRANGYMRESRIAGKSLREISDANIKLRKENDKLREQLAALQAKPEPQPEWRELTNQDTDESVMCQVRDDENREWKDAILAFVDIGNVNFPFVAKVFSHYSAYKYARIRV